MNTKRDLAMNFAVQFCATHSGESLIPVAEAVYRFLAKEEEEEAYEKVYQDIVERLCQAIRETK